MKLIYQQWFFKFDFPDCNNKPYSSNGGKLVWNESVKRNIPLNWDIKTLSNSTEMYQPETFDAKLLKPNGRYRVYGAGGFMGYYDKYNHNDSEIFISCRGSCGNIYRSLPNSLITGNAMIVHPKEIEYSDYLFLTLSEIGVKNCITGSVQPQITRDNLNDWKYCLPPLEIVRKFNEISNPISAEIMNNIVENEELEKLRNELLPLLMNGQVSIV